MRIFGHGLVKLTACLILLTCATISLCGTLHAQSQPPRSITVGQNPDRLSGICNDISSRTEDNGRPDFWSYRYERKIYEAAGVNFDLDTPAVARAKIQSLWIDLYFENFTCDSLNFQIPNGSILKYAVQTRNFSIVDNAMRPWRLELNVIDDQDQETLLGFIEHKITENRGSDTERILGGYAATLRRYGALTCKELLPTQSCSKFVAHVGLKRAADNGAGIAAYNATLFSTHRARLAAILNKK